MTGARGGCGFARRGRPGGGRPGDAAGVRHVRRDAGTARRLLPRTMEIMDGWRGQDGEHCAVIALEVEHFNRLVADCLPDRLFVRGAEGGQHANDPDRQL